MRNVVITGACGGIGQASVSVFAAAGWRVLAVDRADPPVDLHTDDFIQLDVAEPQCVETLVERVGPLHLHALVNNAAVSHDAPMEQTDSYTFDLVLATNLRAPFNLTARFRRHLAAANGAVVNVSSVHAMATSENVSAYAASKGGLVAFTRAAALELAPDGVRCNAVLPGATDTAMLKAGLARRPHREGPQGNRRQLESRTPLRRIGRPEEIAQAILFLADNEWSSFITGQLLVVDGGALARLSTE